MTNALMQLQYFSLNNLVNAVNKVFKKERKVQLKIYQSDSGNK